MTKLFPSLLPCSSYKICILARNGECVGAAAYRVMTDVNEALAGLNRLDEPNQADGHVVSTNIIGEATAQGIYSRDTQKDIGDVSWGLVACQGAVQISRGVDEIISVSPVFSPTEAWDEIPSPVADIPKANRQYHAALRLLRIAQKSLIAASPVSNMGSVDRIPPTSSQQRPIVRLDASSLPVPIEHASTPVYIGPSPIRIEPSPTTPISSPLQA